MAEKHPFRKTHGPRELKTAEIEEGGPDAA
jgi:hypothetical protein